jgi:hypothetical protein
MYTGEVFVGGQKRMEEALSLGDPAFWKLLWMVIINK